MGLNTENEGFSFGVEDTVELGSGNAQLLNDLFNEDVPASTDELEKIENEPPAKKEETSATPPPASPKTKVVKKEEGKDDDDDDLEKTVTELSGQDLIDSFLSDEDEEEEEENEDPLINKKEEEEEGDNKKDTSIFASFAKDLFNIGAFTKDEGEEEVEISTPEQFIERFNLEKKKGADQMIDEFISNFGEDYKSAFEAIFVKGVNPKQYFSSYNEIVDYASLDMTKEENQIKVIKRALSDQGFDPEDIDSEIEEIKNYGDLETKSAKYHKAIVKRDVEKLKQIENDSQRIQTEKLQMKQQYIQSVQSTIQEKLKAKEFDGIPLSGGMAKELTEFLLADKYKTKNGELLTDFDVAIMQLKKPENHLMKVKVGLLLKTLEKDPTLSSIQKSGITKKTNELFSEVNRIGKKTAKASVSTANINSNSNWDI